MRSPALRSNVVSAGVYATGHPGPFLVQVSDSLASFAPQLTMDFISEMASSITKLPITLRANALQYLGPWIKNLPLFTDPCSKLHEPSGTRFRDCIRMIIDLTTAEEEVRKHVYQGHREHTLML